MTRLAEQGVVVQAINYKDRPEDAQGLAGRARRSLPAHRRRPVAAGSAIDWGVYGVPGDLRDRQGWAHRLPACRPAAAARPRADDPAAARAAASDPRSPLAVPAAGRPGAGGHLARRDAAGPGARGARTGARQGAALPRLPEPVDRRFRRRPRPRPAPARARAPGRRRQRRAGDRLTSPSATATSCCSSRR